VVFPDGQPASPLPSRPLLSAEAANQQLRDIVEKFFSWALPGDDGSAVTRLLVRSPPGLGKTREALDWATQYQTDREHGTRKFGGLRIGELSDLRGRFAVFVPRHALADEIKPDIEGFYRRLGRPVMVPILRGRAHDAKSGRAPCRRWLEAEVLGKKGLPVYSNLCRQSRNGETLECPYFRDCEYIRSWRDARDARFIILVHAYLGLGSDSESYARLVDDEEEDEGLLFTPAEVGNLICDEDPSQSLLARERLQKDDLRSIAEGKLAELILAGLDAPAGLLSHLRANTISPDHLRAAAEAQRWDERGKGRVAVPSEPHRDLAKAPPLLRLSRVLERLADEVASGREGAAYSLIPGEDGALIAQGRRRWPFDGRLLILDGTADPDILRAFIPELEVSDEIRVERNAHVVQVTGRTFPKRSLLKSSARYDPDLWREICAFIEMIASRGKTLVVTNKPVRCQLTEEDDNTSLPISAKFGDADVAHFGNIRGSNEFEDHDAVIILGRDEPPVRAAEERAMAIWYDTAEPIERIWADSNGRVNYPKELRPYFTHEAGETTEWVSVHPDHRVQAVVKQIRDAEMLQAIDRLRLIHSDRRKTVYILCNIPLDIPVDRLVTWGQLIPDERLAEAIAQCDARGWEALPLVPKELSRLFPDLWETQKAAERWLSKNPLERSVDIIRDWGVFKYRPVDQRQWSRALILRNIADRSAALGKVLGILSELLHVRASEGRDISGGSQPTASRKPKRRSAPDAQP
jgi:hypothetical protein